MPSRCWRLGHGSCMLDSRRTSRFFLLSEALSSQKHRLIVTSSWATTMTSKGLPQLLWLPSWVASVCRSQAAEGRSRCGVWNLAGLPSNSSVHKTLCSICIRKHEATHSHSLPRLLLPGSKELIKDGGSWSRVVGLVIVETICTLRVAEMF